MPPNSRTLSSISRLQKPAARSSRVATTSTSIPTTGLAEAGWKIGVTDEEPAILKAREGEKKQLDARFSIGLLLDAESQYAIVDVIPGSAADAAGLAPGMKIDGINGRRFSSDVLDDAIKASTARNARALEVLVDNGDFYKTATLRYRGGPRWPHLERDKAVAVDELSKILAPQTPHATRPEKKK